jgi:toxin FitB
VFILDRDVLTIIDGSRRNTNVMKWYLNLDETEIYLSAITIFEMAKNASRLARKGKAADAAKAEAATLSKLKTMFFHKILALGAIAAEDWGRMIGTKETDLWDTATAAIAKEASFHVATRNVTDYVSRGATVTNPFHDPVRVIAP